MQISSQIPKYSRICILNARIYSKFHISMTMNLETGITQVIKIIYPSLVRFLRMLGLGEALGVLTGVLLLLD